MELKAPKLPGVVWDVAGVVVHVIAAPIIYPMAGLLLAMQWLDDKFAPSTVWSPWFAWRPVRINEPWDEGSDYGKTVWLETIWRKRDRWSSFDEYARVNPDDAALTTQGKP